MPKFKTAAQMSWTEWSIFIKASAVLLAARLLVRFVPLRKWRRHFAIHSDGADRTADLTADQQEKVKLVSRMVLRAASNAPIAIICLPQALAARWLLARRGIATQMFVGARKGEGGERDFHAWLKAGELWVTGHCRESDYVLFAEPDPHGNP